MTASAASSAPDDDVFAAARQQYTDQGYAIIEGGLPRGCCEALARDIRAEYARAYPGRPPAGSLSGHLNCFPGSGSQALVDAIEQSGVTRFAAEVFGAPLKLRSVGCNCNLPGSHHQYFHTDSPWASPFIVVNVSLVDTDLSNGAIELIPGSDKAPLPYWKFVATRLSRRGARQPLKAGDILIRPSLLWHRGTPNYSDRMRPMLALTYSAAHAPWTAADYQQNDGRMAFKFNHFRPTLFGRLMEILSVYLPWACAMLLSAKSLGREP